MDIKNQIINKKINEKILLEEMAKKRNDEIKKRKYLTYNEQRNTNEDDNTKYFFDEKAINKVSEQKKDLTKKEILVAKKELIKKNNNKSEVQRIERNNQTAFNSKKSIVKLKNKQFVEKTEIFYFKDGEVELEINQKMKINEYVSQIRNKPIKIQIRPAYIMNEKEKVTKQLAKSRSLLIRAYLVKLGISHNRIKILLEDTDSNVSINEVTINFIES